MTDTCPTWPTLLAWLENDLPDEESQLLNTHVADCDEWRERVALMSAVQEVSKAGTCPGTSEVSGARISRQRSGCRIRASSRHVAATDKLSPRGAIQWHPDLVGRQVAVTQRLTKG